MCQIQNGGPKAAAADLFCSLPCRGDCDIHLAVRQGPTRASL